MSITPETQLVIDRFPCGPFRDQREVRAAVAEILAPEPPAGIVLTSNDEVIRAAAADAFLERVDWAEALYWLGTGA